MTNGKAAECGHPRSSSWKVWVRALGPVVLLPLAVALVLALVLEGLNPPHSGLAAFFELWVVMLWLVLPLHVAGLLGLGVLLLAIRRFAAVFLVRRLGRLSTQLTVALVVFHLAFAVLPRVSLAYQWASARPFVTKAGFLQIVFFVLSCVAFWFLGLALVERWTARSRLLWLAALVTASSTVAVLIWKVELDVRRVPNAALHQSAVDATASGSVERPDETMGSDHSPVVLLCLDGFSWSVAQPLLEAGYLPELATRMTNGRVGYLDNRGSSFSPLIWHTIWSGQLPERHRVFAFRKLVLPKSGRELDNLATIRPTIRSVYSIDRLLEALPNPGLWRLEAMTSQDREAPMLWDITSGFDAPSVVYNVLLGHPAPAIEGVVIDQWEGGENDSSGFHPSNLAAEVPALPEVEFPDASDDLREVEASLALQFETFFDQVGAVEPAVAVFFSLWVDWLAHNHWDFHSEDAFLLTDLPVHRSATEWKELVIANREHPVFAIYETFDRFLAQYREQLDSSTMVLVSDHGWTFSGVEHFGSPDGVVLISGDAVAPGYFAADPSVLDITPTVLALAGLPVAADLPGRVVREAFRTEPVLEVVPSFSHIVPGRA